MFWCLVGILLWLLGRGLFFRGQAPLAIESLAIKPREEVATEPDQILKQWSDWAQRYPKQIVKTADKVYLLQDPAAIKLACSQLTHKAPTSNFLIPFLGPASILPANGKEWRAKRTLMNGILKGVLAEERYESIASSTANEVLQMELEPLDALRLYTHLTAMRIIVGKDYRASLADCLAFAKHLKTILEVLVVRYFDPVKRNDPDFETKHPESKEALEFIKRAVPSWSRDELSLLSLYRTALPADEAAVRGEIYSLITGSVDNSYSTLAFTLYHLAKNPVEQGWLRSAPAYANAVIMETLRVYPVITDMSRLVDRDDFELATPEGRKIHVPRGTQLDWSLWALHRDPTNFGEGAAFCPRRRPTVLQQPRISTEGGRVVMHNPDGGKISFGHGSFEVEEPKNAAPRMAIPFGLGARDCPGKNMALIIVSTMIRKISQEYQVSTNTEVLEVEMDLILRPKNLQLAFKRL